MNIKKTKNLRNVYLSCRLNEQERRALDVMSAREGMPLSDLTRTLIREAMEARGVKTLGLMDLLYQGEAQNADPLK
jgi:hypothetical protein